MIGSLREWAYRRGIFRPVELPAFVVSVGNLSTGGTGKSPMALLLAEHFLARGISTAVLSRGYRRRSRNLVVLKPGGDLPEAKELGDEPWMIRHRLPGISLLVHRDRVRKAQRHWQDLGSPRLVILDDAFQHWRASRDRDIVMVDATESLDQKTLPFGRLRERVEAVRRADLVVITRAGAIEPDRLLRVEQRLRHLLEQRRSAVWKRESLFHDPVPILAADYELERFFDAVTEKEIPSLADREVLLLAGIAKPEGLRRLARNEGLEVREEIYFADHYSLRARDEEAIRRAMLVRKRGIALMTEKDWARWRPFFVASGIPGAVAQVRFRFREGDQAKLDAFFADVEAKCST